MLVLRRKTGETIMLNGVIEIRILAVERGERVKIGINAPPDINVVRGELLYAQEEYDEEAIPPPYYPGIR